jgi:MFS family permease
LTLAANSGIHVKYFRHGGDIMSFRYKSALLSLVSLALVYGWYFAAWTADRHAGLSGDEPMRLIGTVIAVAVLQIVGTILIALTSSDKWGSMDERERGFDRRATNAGYYVLIAGALTAAATLHIGAHPHDMADAILLAVVVAECVRQAVFLISHHKAA